MTNRVSSFLTPDGSATLDPATETVIVDFPHPSEETLHGSGRIAFGRDGALFASFGDDGPEGAPTERAQDPLSPFCKLLRIPLGSPDGPDAGGREGAHDAVWQRSGGPAEHRAV